MATADVTLIKRWAERRDADAFRELVQRYAHMVFATSRRILGNADDAEDVTQDCFLKLSRVRESMRNVPAWLHRVATRRSLDVIRSESRRRALHPRPVSRDGPEAEIAWKEVEACVDEAMETLPEAQRLPLVHHFLQSRTQEETARLLGISKATVSYRISKGIERIRLHLARRGFEVTASVLGAWLSTSLAEAAPSSLLAALGKIAVSGGALHPRRPAAPRRTAARVSSAALVKAGATKVWVSLGAATLLLGIAAVAASGLLDRDVAVEPAAEAPPPPVAAVEPKEPPAPPSAGAEEEPEPESSPEEVVAGTDAALQPVAISGTVRGGEQMPLASAQVFVAFHPIVRDAILGEEPLRADYWKRESFLAATTDLDGRYAFADVRLSGKATVSAFVEGRKGVTRQIELEPGQVQEGVDLVVEEGKTLRGQVVRHDGTPVTDAIVSVYQAWHAKDMAWGWGFGPTDAQGRFRLGLSKGAAHCTLLVNSESDGQDFFVDVECSKGDVRLVLQDTAVVRGTITWADATPAAGLVVCLTGTVPEPNIPVTYSGWRPGQIVQATVDADGRYERAGLQPGLDYAICVIDSEPTLQKALLSPLSPRWKNRFQLSAGEVKEWDYVVERVIVVKGTVLTERSRKPVPRVRIGAFRNGEDMRDLYVEADEHGAFELRIISGPGTYRVFAAPEPAGFGAAKVLAERFGEELRLESGETIEQDLLVFEPTVLPLRVLDARRQPVRSIRYKLRYSVPGARPSSLESSKSLDETGRTEFVMYFPVTEFSLSISPFPEGPWTEAGTYAGGPGLELREATVVLVAAADLKVTLVDAQGQPRKKRRVTFDVTYRDGVRRRFGERTDDAGALLAKGCLRAEPLSLKVRVQDVEGASELSDLDASSGLLDLGTVTVP